MDPTQMRERLAAARVGRLATVTTDGHPHVVPICFVLVDEVVFTAVDHKPKRSAALKRIDNIAATGRATLLVDFYDDDWTRLWWVRVDTGASLVQDDLTRERALDALAAKYPQYVEHRPAGAVLKLRIDRWSGWAGMS